MIFFCTLCLNLRPICYRIPLQHCALQLFEYLTSNIFIFFYLGFLSQPFTNHRTAGEEGGYFHPLYRHLRHQPDDYCRELTSVDRQQSDSNREPLVSEHKLLTTKLRALVLCKHQFFRLLCLTYIFLPNQILKKYQCKYSFTLIISITGKTSPLSTLCNST